MPSFPSTKKIGDSFAGLFQHPRLRMHLNVEVGRDVTHADIAAHHHAVIYAVGAAADKTLGIPGEDLRAACRPPRSSPGPARIPTYGPARSICPAERAVIIGNGNVAVDVARILLSDPEDLASTNIADHALKTLRTCKVREVVLLGAAVPNRQRSPARSSWRCIIFLACGWWSMSTPRSAPQLPEPRIIPQQNQPAVPPGDEKSLPRGVPCATAGHVPSDGHH